MLMIFDLLTSPQGHQFDPRMKKFTCILFCSSSPSIWYATRQCLKKILFDPLGTPVPQSPTPGAWPKHQNKYPIWYVLYLSFVRTHTKFGIKIVEIDMLMIFDLLTSPQGHQFDPRMKMLLAFCSCRHPHRFDMLHDNVWKKYCLTPLGTPSAPKSHPWGMTQASE